MKTSLILGDDQMAVSGIVVNMRTPEELAKLIAHKSQTSWHNPIRKTIYTLNINNYEPAICDLTYPLLRHYAKKIGASFQVISERKFPEWPTVYEKLQIFELGREAGNDWNIYIDSDALVNPEMFDVTDHLSKDTVCHNGRDMNGVRWEMDAYFRRDGRWIGSCNWFAVASDWCLDLWHPLEDLTPAEAAARIHPTTAERSSGQFKDGHLIDDYTLSRNIARFGLKFTTVTKICGDLGWKMPRTIVTQAGQTLTWGQEMDTSPYLFHLYNIPTDQKIEKMLGVLSTPQDRGGWGLMSQKDVEDFKNKWGIK
jgi:hypothetical protein